MSVLGIRLLRFLGGLRYGLVGGRIGQAVSSQTLAEGLLEIEAMMNVILLCATGNDGRIDEIVFKGKITGDGD